MNIYYCPHCNKRYDLNDYWDEEEEKLNFYGCKCENRYKEHYEAKRNAEETKALREKGTESDNT